MKRTFVNLITLLLIFASLSSCKKDGNQIKSSEAKKVNKVNSNNTITYNNIKAGSYLDWRGYHLGGTGERLGKVYYKQASALINNNKITNLSVLIDMPSLTVDNLKKESAYDLSEHLKHSDFFDVENYPTSKFELTNLKEIEGEYNSKIIGNLTILGITKSISFRANIYLSEHTISIKSEDFVIDRSDWNMTYNAKGTIGVSKDYLISDDVGFTVNLELAK